MGHDKRACWLADAGGRGSTKSDNRGNNNQPQQQHQHQQQSSHRREVKTCPKISAPMVPNIADATAGAATGATAAVLHVQYDDINSSIMRLFTILSLSSSLCVDAPLITT